VDGTDTIWGDVSAMKKRLTGLEFACMCVCINNSDSVDVRHLIKHLNDAALQLLLSQTKSYSN
jgi:hypothetical protein